MKTKKPVGDPITGPNGTIASLAFSPDSKYLASGSADSSVILWNVNTHKQVGKPFEGHTAYVTSVAFSPNGRYLAAGSSDNQIIIWSTLTHKQEGDLLQSVYGGIYTIAFSPDGQTLASGSNAGFLQFWDLATHKQIGNPIQGQPIYIRSLAFSPDGKTLATVGDNSLVNLWDVSSQKLVIALNSDYKQPLMSVVYSPDGNKLITGGKDKVIKIWNVNFDSFQNYVCIKAERNLTYEEWEEYFPGKTYHLTCDNLPIAQILNDDSYISVAQAALEANDKPSAENIYTEMVKRTAESTDMDANSKVCWYGSIDGFAKVVLPSCEKAVALATSQNSKDLAYYRDARGMAYALLGKKSKAISDFRAFLEYSKTNETYYENYGKRRETWIIDLGNNNDPFTEEYLHSLRSNDCH